MCLLWVGIVINNPLIARLNPYLQDAMLFSNFALSYYYLYFLNNNTNMKLRNLIFFSIHSFYRSNFNLKFGYKESISAEVYLSLLCSVTFRRHVIPWRRRTWTERLPCRRLPASWTFPGKRGVGSCEDASSCRPPWRWRRAAASASLRCSVAGERGPPGAAPRDQVREAKQHVTSEFFKKTSD